MGIWKYLDKDFKTKIERDMYQRGYEDGIATSTKHCCNDEICLNRYIPEHT